MSTEASIDSMMEEEQKRAGTHYKTSKRFDNLATVILWTAAAVTLGILVYILGFIIYKGLRSDNVIESELIDRGTIESPLEWYSGDSILIVNKDVRLKTIEYDDLSDLMSGKPSNWGNINDQDLDAYPFVLSSALNSDEFKFGKKTTVMQTASELAAAVERQEGAFGIIPASLKTEVDNYKINIIPVKPLGITVHPSVFEIKDNIKIRFLDGKMLQQVLRGEVSNWQEVGGIDLPLRLILPPAGSYEFEAYLDIADITPQELPETAVQTAYTADYYEKIKSYPGSIGLIIKKDAEEHSLGLIKYQYRETGRNLQLWFLFEEPKRAGRVGGISSIIVNTIYMVLLTVLFSTPIGIGAAVYLTEYATQGRLIKILRLGTETLAGIPSIIFGLFGFIVFVGAMHLGIGLLSGTLTLTLMILPTIVRTSEEAIKAVPRSFRAGSLALGAGKWQTIYKVVIPAAAPGILTGVILAIGRAVGETAALLFTMGFDYRRVKNLSTSARVLSTHLYQLVKEGISFDRAFATATILIVIVLVVNVLSTKLVVRKY